MTPPFIGIRALLMQNVDYLNLELNNYSQVKLTSDQNKIQCNFLGNCKHLLHSEQSQLNTLIDFNINLAKNFKIQFDKLENCFRLVSESLSSKFKTLRELDNKIEFVKDQNIDIIEKLNKNFSIQERFLLDKEVQQIKIQQLIKAVKTSEIEVETKTLIKNVQIQIKEVDINLEKLQESLFNQLEEIKKLVND